jgi:arginine decarboxylase
MVSKEIIQFMLALDVKEIHGYRADLGLKVFAVKALNRKNTISAMGAMHAIQAMHLGEKK